MLCTILSTGAIQPCFALLFARNMTLLSNPPPSALHKAAILALLFFLIGVLDLLLHVLQGFLFGVSGHALTTRLRFAFFRTLIYKDIAWYDREENSVSRFTAQLATDCAKIQVSHLRFHPCLSVGHRLGCKLISLYSLL